MKTHPIHTAVFVMTCAILPCIANAQIVYEQDFNNSTGSAQPVSSISGWLAYGGSTAINYSSNTGIVPIPSASGSTGTNGYVQMNMGTSSGSTGSFAVLTGGLSLNVADGEISWAATSPVNFVRTSLLIQINNTDWLISNTAFQPTTFTSNWSLHPSEDYINTVAFSTLASDWSAFTLTPGSAMSVGSVLSSDLSATTITGIGIYAWNLNGTDGTATLVDTLTITVPEPATAALLLGVVMGGGLLRRSR